uniref:Uncharacterized protein n=1 Tax=Acrobeloides nanus TaxID=290746 RepID=A0A914CRF8_9BILA
MDDKIARAGHTTRRDRISTHLLLELVKKKIGREWNRLHYPKRQITGLHEYVSSGMTSQPPTENDQVDLREYLDVEDYEEYLSQQPSTSASNEYTQPSTSAFKESMVSPGWRKRKANQEEKKLKF